MWFFVTGYPQGCPYSRNFLRIIGLDGLQNVCVTEWPTLQVHSFCTDPVLCIIDSVFVNIVFYFLSTSMFFTIIINTLVSVWAYMYLGNIRVATFCDVP